MRTIKNSFNGKKVLFLSYNSRGFSDQKQNFCKLLLDENIVGNHLAILCNQENFLLRSSSYKINRTFPSHHCFINPAIKTSHDKGRARNGMFIAVPTCMINTVTDVSPGHWRIQALTITSSSSTTLLINSYFPVDPKTNNFDELELNETLQVINCVLEENTFQSVLFLGDINCDFRRNNGFVRIVESFLLETNLQKAWDKFDVDFTHFQEANEISHVSIIDHFFWNGSIDQSILQAGVIHHPDNASDHAPIYCSIDMEAITVETATPDHSQPTAKPSWKLATSEQKKNFPTIMQRNLIDVSIPEEIQNCRNTKCNNPGHCDMADEFMMKIMDCVEKSAAEALPVPEPKRNSPSKSKPKPVPGWSEMVKPFRDNAYFWHQVWVSAGKPLNTQLHNIMKRTRNCYHFQYRKCKKAENIVIKNKLLDACINGNGDIFKEIKKLRRSKPTVATSMDG